MNSKAKEGVSVALCGDVMTGRGIDQILPHPSDPSLQEAYVHDARDYVALAIDRNGPVPLPVPFDYVWGDALAELGQADVRIVNLETSITRNQEHWPDKEIHYRMHPQNIECLRVPHLDCCALANNHVLDWGYEGLHETVRTLDGAGIAHVGAGHDASAAAAPVALPVAGGGRVLVRAIGSPSASVFAAWAASTNKPGVNLLPEISVETASQVARDLLRITRQDDITVVSIHWGGNWGYQVSSAERAFARRLIDEGIDIVHGHSSHHAKGIELHRGRLILYGCGDFLNDYEGIGGHAEYRGDLVILFRAAVVLQPQRSVVLTLVPFQLRRMRLNRAHEEQARWLHRVLQRESARFDTSVVLQRDLTMTVTEA